MPRAPEKWSKSTPRSLELVASAKAQAWGQAGRVQGGDCPKEEGHSQRVLWAQPGVWGGALFGEETREEGTEAGTAWRLQSRSLANRGDVGGAGRGGSRGGAVRSLLPFPKGTEPTPQHQSQEPLCLTRTVAVVHPRGRCVGSPHLAACACAPCTVPFSVFRHQ